MASSVSVKKEREIKNDTDKFLLRDISIVKLKRKKEKKLLS